MKGACAWRGAEGETPGMSKRIRLTLISISCFLLFYIIIGGLLGKNESSTQDKAYRDLGVYSEVLTRIKHDYVTEPSLTKVTDGAIRGLLEALDPYSTYFTPQQYQAYLQQPEPGPGDVGLFAAKRLGFATVVSMLPGSPAEKAGIKLGDLLDLVEGESTRELSVVQIMRALAGPPGSTVTLAVVREARGEPQKMILTRTALIYPPVITKMIDDDAYLRVATFNKGKAAELAAKLKELGAQGAKKAILDLRNCAGGDPQEAIATANLFLDKGLITYITGQRYPREDVNANSSKQVWRLPMAVLINQSTAGPAELVASAILGNKRGEIVGIRSFGVGVVQKLIPVGDGSAILLSVAKYYGPDGRPIHDNGVTPSVIQSAGREIASADDEENEQETPEQFGGKDDLQLQKAIEILKQGSAPAKAA
jgi:carboxyl-terminal processing protease